MKLKALRQCYKSVGKDWVRKKGYVSEDEIKRELFNSKDIKCHHYRCGICGLLHVVSHSRARK